VNLLSSEYHNNVVLHREKLQGYAQGSLYYLPSILGSTTTVGLHEGTLYDVPEPNGGTGTMSVNATGFNITCGRPTQVDVRFSWTRTEFSANTSAWFMSLDKDNYTSHDYEILSTRKTVLTDRISTHSAIEPGIISMAEPADGPSNAIVLYSTVPIIDTNGDDGFWVDLTPPMNNSLSSIQVLKCSQLLVNQTAVVDAQSGKFLSVSPEIKKTTSTWSPYSGHADIREPQPKKTKSGNLYIDAVSRDLNDSCETHLIGDWQWATWYVTMPPTGTGFTLDANIGGPFDLASVADVYVRSDWGNRIHLNARHLGIWYKI
jgi:hypothetical protein